MSRLIPIFAVVFVCWAAAALAQAPVVPRSTIPGAHRDPNARARAEMGRAHDYLRLRDFEKALVAARNAAHYDTLSSLAQELLGACYVATGEPRAAYQAYQRATLLDPSSANAFNRAGQVLLQFLGRPAGAKRAFEQALALDPRYAPAHYSMHFYHLLRGELEESLKALETASDNARTDDEKYLFFGAHSGFFLYSGNYLSGVSKLRAHNEQVGGDGRALQAQALAERLAGLYVDSEEGIRGLLAVGSRDPGLIVDLGLALRAQGQRDTASAYLREALAMDSTRFDSRYNLALESLAAGDTAAALAGLSRAWAFHPEAYAIPLLAGRIHEARGEPQAARLAFERAFRLAPITRGAARAAGEPQLLEKTWESDTLFAAIEAAMLEGDLGIAGHKSIQASPRPEPRALALAFVALAKAPTPGSAGQRVAHLEAARERAGKMEPAFVAYLDTQLAEAHAEIGNADDAERLFRSVVERKDLPPDARTAALASYLRWVLASGRQAGVTQDLAAFDSSTDGDLWALRARLAEVGGDTATAERCRARAADLAYLP